MNLAPNCCSESEGVEYHGSVIVLCLAVGFAVYFLMVGDVLISFSLGVLLIAFCYLCCCGRYKGRGGGKG